MAVTQLARHFTVSTIRQPRSLNRLFWFSKVPHIRACSISNCKLKVAERQHWWASFGKSAREGKDESKDMVSVATTSTVELKIWCLSLFIRIQNASEKIGHFPVAKASVSKWAKCEAIEIKRIFFNLVQIKLILTTKVVQLASFWKWGFLELGNGLLATCESLVLNFYSRRK